jgi:hypothetical protein
MFKHFLFAVYSRFTDNFQTGPAAGDRMAHLDAAGAKHFATVANSAPA